MRKMKNAEQIKMWKDEKINCTILKKWQKRGLGIFPNKRP